MFLVQDFCPLKIKIQYSMPSGFRLNHFATEKRAKPSPVKGSGDK